MAGGKLANYFQVFVRLGGIVHRASGMCLREKLTPPGSRPPQEDLEELIDCDFWAFPNARSTMSSDGAKAWPSSVKKKHKHLRFTQVNHRKCQWTKPTTNNKGVAVAAGTQVATSKLGASTAVLK